MDLKVNREREAVKEGPQNKEEEEKWKKLQYMPFFPPLIRFASYLFGSDNSFTQGLPTASQSCFLTG